ncbi:type IV pilus modification PilV family protein [Paenibacillus koleovorans]|uniref:type IV pilus modification PilV family protein n=1 Tax=Paenibacillus koleovorans TaxID=121608 RepID=UPI000FDB4930|nr:prepilin-type N-terminal cleavage/methylation domain-containing protein [Paenibacillus koleovorans]
MSRLERFRKQFDNEDGISLVEILIGVTIMAIISTILMGNFTSAMDKSAEESRRIIAANLGRLKVAELRDHFKEAYEEPMGGETRYSGSLADPSDSAIMEGLLEPTVVNGTTYRYLVRLNDSHHRWEATDAFKTDSNQYLAQMLVTVYWSGEESLETPPAKSSTTLDTYLVKGW